MLCLDFGIDIICHSLLYLMKISYFFLQVIDRVAVLCSKSISNAEMHVQTSSHDAVCAVYNLLLDDAMKIYKTKVKARAKHRPTSSVGRQISDRKEDGRIVETETPNTRLTSITDKNSGKKCDSNPSSSLQRRADAPSIVEEEPIEFRGSKCQIFPKRFLNTFRGSAYLVGFLCLKN